MENITNDFVKNVIVTQETWFTHKEKITLNHVSIRICLRVRKYSKTFIMRFLDTGRTLTLGHWDQDLFTLEQAQYKAMQILSGDVKEEEFDNAPSFRKMIEQVLDFNENVLKRKSVYAQRARVKQIPDDVLDTPITILRHRHAQAVRNHFLDNYTAGSFNCAISELSAYWKAGKREFYRELLEDRGNPFEDYKIKNVAKKKRIKPKFDDVINMWRKIDNHEIDNYWKLFWKLKICLGCHNTELLNMTSDNLVEDELGTWFVWGVGHHKNSNNQNQIEHRVWIHPKLKELITEHLREYKIEKYWFYSRSLNYGEQKQEKANRQAPTTRWKRLRVNADINFSSDLFRHALVTYLNVRGYKSDVVTGHCYTGSTQKEHYMNWEDPSVLNQFKEVGQFYQEAIFNEVDKDPNVKPDELSNVINIR
ncbi:hypothetical protein OA493_01465 [Gammaproteobacteria bacterium]|nr:hypothetical protein [Gammaproteobacteria bacterium]